MEKRREKKEEEKTTSISIISKNATHAQYPKNRQRLSCFMRLSKKPKPKGKSGR